MPAAVAAAAGGVLDAVPGAGAAAAELLALEGRWTCVNEPMPLTDYTSARIFTCDSKVFGILFRPTDSYADASLEFLQDKARKGGNIYCKRLRPSEDGAM